MPAPKGSKNALGNKGGRTYPNRDIQVFYEALDKTLPNVVRSVNETMEQADRGFQAAVIELMEASTKPFTQGFTEYHKRVMMDSIVRDMVQWKKLKLEAAKILISKAPERIVGEAGGPVKIVVERFKPEDV